MKEWKTYEDLVDYSLESKNIEFNNCEKETAINIFSLLNYTNIISPYKIYFYTDISDENKHIYSIKTSFSDYITLYKYDMKISRFIQSICYEFETFFTTSLIHLLSREIFKNSRYILIREYQIKNDLLKNLSNLFLADKQKLSDFSVLVNDDKELDYDIITTNKFYKTYKNLLTIKKMKKLSYDNLTSSKFNCYIDILSLSLGEKIALFMILNNEIKKEIINHLSIPSIDDLKKFSVFLERLRIVRNGVSHFENLTALIDKQVKHTINTGKKTIVKYSINDNCVFQILCIASKFYSQKNKRIEHILSYSNIDLNLIETYKTYISDKFSVRKKNVKLSNISDKI